jgi:hypothetical protein
LPNNSRFGGAETGKESKVYGEMRSEPVPFLYLFSAKFRRNRATVFRLAGRERLAGRLWTTDSLKALGRAPRWAGWGNAATSPPATPLTARTTQKTAFRDGTAETVWLGLIWRGKRR